MKQLSVYICMTNFIFFTSSLSVTFRHCVQLSDLSAVTYDFNGGRFGDNLHSYCKAKWLSYKYDIPVLYQPFKYSDQLMLHKHEIKWRRSLSDHFDQIVKLPLHDRFSINPFDSILYISQWKTKVSIDWNDQEFIMQLKKMIAPRYKIAEISIPPDCVSVAVHVRTGGDYKADNIMRSGMPLRFAPDHFYVDQIERIAQMFEGERLYVYIFTDDSYPEKIVKKFSDAVCNDRIVWGYRQTKNRYNANVLDDFFSIMKFDCLIRSGSNFSRFAQYLGNYQVTIYPRHARYITKNKWIIDKIAILQRTDDGWKVRKK